MEPLSAPVVVLWEITNSCNQQCLHCFNFWVAEKKGVDQHQMNDAGLLSRITSELIRNKVYHVVITGGEPLLNFAVILPFLRELSANGIHISLNSNLTLLTHPIAKELKDLEIPVLVSVPSCDPMITEKITGSKDAFTKIEKGIRLAIEYGLRLSANMVITHENLGQIYSTACYVQKLGIPKFGATKACTPIINGNFSQVALTIEEARTIFLELLKIKQILGLEVDSFIGYPLCLFPPSALNILNGRVCHAGQTTCTIGVNGDVRACGHLEKHYGNIQRNNLKEIWQAMSEWRDGSLTPAQCAGCDFEGFCAGGCKAESLIRYGQINLPDPYADFSNPVTMRKPSRNLTYPIERIRYLVNSDFYFRKEDSGGLLITDRFLHFDDNLFEFLVNRIGQIVSVEDFVHHFGWSVQATQGFFRRLIRDKVLVRVSPKSNKIVVKINSFC